MEFPESHSQSSGSSTNQVNNQGLDFDPSQTFVMTPAPEQFHADGGDFTMAATELADLNVPPFPDLGTYIPVVDGQFPPEYLLPEGAPFQLTETSQLALDLSFDEGGMSWLDAKFSLPLDPNAFEGDIPRLPPHPTSGHLPSVDTDPSRTYDLFQQEPGQPHDPFWSYFDLDPAQAYQPASPGYQHIGSQDVEAAQVLLMAHQADVASRNSKDKGKGKRRMKKTGEDSDRDSVYQTDSDSSESDEVKKKRQRKREASKLYRARKKAGLVKPRAPPKGPPNETPREKATRRQREYRARKRAKKAKATTSNLPESSSRASVEASANVVDLDTDSSLTDLEDLEFDGDFEFDN